jgi:bacillithiol system protein YtxJ
MAALARRGNRPYNQLSMQNASKLSNLTHLSDVDMLEAAIAESRERPVLLFKHSRTCGISCEALDELHAHVAGSEAKAAYKVITVQSHRRLSDTAAERFGIRHETPQAILLRDGQPVWNASHFRITAQELGRLLD